MRRCLDPEGMCIDHVHAGPLSELLLLLTYSRMAVQQ